jgi:hypothetical protein
MVLLKILQVNQNGSVEWHVTERSVHKYSRLVYFRSLLMGLQGETNPTITSDEIATLKQWIVNHPGGCTATPASRVNLVKIAMKCTGLPKRHVRHAVTIATSVFGKNSSLLDLPGHLMSKFSRYFRHLEHAWQHSEVKKQRTYFLNYSFLIEEMCRRWHVFTPIGGIKSKVLRQRQVVLYNSLVQDAKRQCNVADRTVFFEF